MNYKYDDTIIKNPTQYDALEVQGMREVYSDENREDTCYKLDNDNPQFYTVYVQIKEGGFECIGNFSERQDAIDYAYEVMKKYGFNWTIYDYTKVQTFADEAVPL